MSLKDAAADVKKGMEKEEEDATPVVAPTRKNLLSTGSTLLNLACSDNHHGGFLKGKYYFLVGDSASGKTFLSMTCFAEAVYHRRFKNYRLIYDNVEDGCLIDLASLFSEKVADKVEPPSVDEEGAPKYSSTIEEFYYHLDDANKKGTPFIYVLDSMDALSSGAEINKFEEHKKAFQEGKDSAGSYGDGKAKKNSEGLRKALAGIRSNGSILIILCQTRDNITGIGYEKKTRSGGRALKFYATMEIWSSIVGSIRKNVNGKDRQVGVKVRLQIKKNRITGKLQEATVPIYPSYGIDDLGSCVDYLLEEGYWETRKNTIVAKGLNLEGTREKLIAKIEENKLEDEVRSLVGKCWKEVDQACSLKRKKRYTDEEE